MPNSTTVRLNSSCGLFARENLQEEGGDSQGFPCSLAFLLLLFAFVFLLLSAAFGQMASFPCSLACLLAFLLALLLFAFCFESLVKFPL